MDFQNNFEDIADTQRIVVPQTDTQLDGDGSHAMYNNVLVPQLNTNPSPIDGNYIDNLLDVEPAFDPDFWKMNVKDMTLDTSLTPVKVESTSAAESDGESESYIDSKIYNIFPVEALRMKRTDFTAWKKTYKNPAVRSLSQRESKRLSALRRVILARVYAEKARVKKGQEADSMKSRLSRLQEENAKLHSRVRNLESILVNMQNQFARSRRSTLGRVTGK